MQISTRKISICYTNMQFSTRKIWKYQNFLVTLYAFCNSTKKRYDETVDSKHNVVSGSECADAGVYGSD